MNCSSDKCLIYRYLMTGYIGQVSSIQGLKQIATPPTAPKCPLLAFVPLSCLLAIPATSAHNDQLWLFKTST